MKITLTVIPQWGAHGGGKVRRKQIIRILLACAVGLLPHVGKCEKPTLIDGNKGEVAYGVVHYDKGLVLRGNVAVNLPLRVDGEVVLEHNSVMKLDGDLCIKPKAETLVIGYRDGSAASIDGAGNTLHLAGDLKLPLNRTLNIVGSDLVIDGHGNKLTFGNDNAKIVVAKGKTLTLKNMTIKGLCGSEQLVGGNVRLSNVVIDLAPAAVWRYAGPDGEMEIEGDVVVRGGGAFAFKGKKLEVKDFSTLCFDLNTTFEWAADRNALLMKDATAHLFMNGSTLHAKAKECKGIAFKKGTLVLGNKVVIDNDDNQDAARSVEFCDDEHDEATVKVLAGAQVEVRGYVQLGKEEKSRG